MSHVRTLRKLLETFSDFPSVLTLSRGHFGWAPRPKCLRERVYATFCPKRQYHAIYPAQDKSLQNLVFRLWGGGRIVVPLVAHFLKTSFTKHWIFLQVCPSVYLFPSQNIKYFYSQYHSFFKNLHILFEIFSKMSPFTKKTFTFYSIFFNFFLFLKLTFSS